MLVLRPEYRSASSRGRVDNAVGKRERVTRRFQSQRRIHVYELANLHHAGDLERVVFAAFPQNFLENFVNGNDRHEKIFGVLNRGGKQGGPVAVREIFEPAG